MFLCVWVVEDIGGGVCVCVSVDLLPIKQYASTTTSSSTPGPTRPLYESIASQSISASVSSLTSQKSTHLKSADLASSVSAVQHPSAPKRQRNNIIPKKKRKRWE